MSYGYTPGLTKSAASLVPAFGDLSVPLVHLPTKDVPNLTHQFPANPGVAAKETALLWDTTLTEYPPVARAQHTINRLGELRTAWHNSDRSLATLLDVDPDNFDAKFEEIVTNRNDFPFTEGELRTTMTRADEQRTKSIKTTGYFDHMVNQLPIKTAAKKFAAAVQELGINAFDQGTASNTNPQEFATLMEEGKKLSVLPQLLPLHVRGTEETAALFAAPTELPPLAATEGKNGTATRHFNEADEALHVKTREGIRHAKNLSSFLIALALDIYPGLELNVATSWATIEKRTEQFKTIGAVKANMKDGTNRRIYIV